MQFKLGNAIVPNKQTQLKTPKLPVINNTTQPGVPAQGGPHVVPIGQAVVGGLQNNEQRRTVGTDVVGATKVAASCGKKGKKKPKPGGKIGTTSISSIQKDAAFFLPAAITAGLGYLGGYHNPRAARERQRRDWVAGEAMQKIRGMEAGGQLGPDGRPVEGPGWWHRYVSTPWSLVTGANPDRAFFDRNPQYQALLHGPREAEINRILSGVTSLEDIENIRQKALAEPLSEWDEAYKRALAQTGGQLGQPIGQGQGWGQPGQTGYGQTGPRSALWSDGRRGGGSSIQNIHVPMEARARYQQEQNRLRQEESTRLRAERRAAAQQHVSHRPQFAHSTQMGGIGAQRVPGAPQQPGANMQPTPVGAQRVPTQSATPRQAPNTPRPGYTPMPSASEVDRSSGPWLTHSRRP